MVQGALPPVGWGERGCQIVAEAGEELTEARIWRLPIGRYPHRRRPRRHRGTGSRGGLRDGARGGLDGPPTPGSVVRRLSPTTDDGVAGQSTSSSRRSPSESDGPGGADAAAGRLGRARMPRTVMVQGAPTPLPAGWGEWGCQISGGGQRGA